MRFIPGIYEMVAAGRRYVVLLSAGEASQSRDIALQLPRTAKVSFRILSDGEVRDPDAAQDQVNATFADILALPEVIRLP